MLSSSLDQRRSTPSHSYPPTAIHNYSDMFARTIVIAAAIALAAAHVKREHAEDYSPYKDDYNHDVEYKKPAYKESEYDKAYDYAFDHYAHEAKEDRRRGLGYGETWEDNFERRHVSLLPLSPSFDTLLTLVLV